MENSADHHFPWRIFAFAGIIALTWLAVTAWTGLRADLAESNLQANLIRITRYLQADSPGIVLAGSSISGRLLPEFFDLQVRELHNLGLDGSGPSFAFEVMSKGANRPEIVLLEADTLFRPLSANDAVLRAAMTSTTAKLSKQIPLVRPEVRPLTVAYAKLKSWRDSAAQGRQRTPEIIRDDKTEIPENYDSVKKEVTALMGQGTQVVLVNMPDGEGWAMPLSGPAKKLADELGLDVLEPGSDIYLAEGDVLRFTDGLHLDGPSAAKVSETLAIRLQELSD
jgi:hypothetical protein